MKRIFILGAILGGSLMANAQVGIGTPTPVDSSMLEVAADDKGVLIPRVSLVKVDDFAPLTGNKVESMLVYNIGSALPHGFYYWNETKWSKITTREELDKVIEGVVAGDVKNFKDILNYLVPSNPESASDPNTSSLTHTAMLYDDKDGLFYGMVYDAKTNSYTRKEIKLKEFVAASETKTKILKSVVTANGKLPEFSASKTAPVEANVKKGDVFYKYLGENGEINYINMSSDVLNVIENSESIKQQITNIVNKGGNVYYTDKAIGKIPAKSLYQVNDKNEKEIIDITSNVLTVIEQNIDKINNDLSTNVIDGKIVNVGRKIDGLEVFSIKKKIKITGAATEGVDVTSLLTGKQSVERIVTVNIYNSKKVLVASTITDAVIDKNKMKFNIGQGKLYTILPTDTYDAIVEFTMTK